MSWSPTQRPNVVWITLDSVRQDHTSIDGYDRETTPNLQSIANRPSGVAFDTCIAAANWSLPSAASIATGTYPEYHRTGYDTDVLSENVDTVAERFRDVGYHTVGVSANHYFSEATGLDRGFEEFKEIMPSEFVSEVPARTLLEFLLKIRTHSGGFTREKTKHRPDYLVNEIVKNQLSACAESDGPFFVSAHYHGAHVPYYPPPTWQDTFESDLIESPRAASERAFRHTADLHTAIGKTEAFTEEDWNALSVMYDTLVAYSDALVGDLFDHLEALPLDDTVFVVTADHGDLLGEQGLLGHKFVLHDGLTRVPAVVHGLDALVDQSDELIQHLDIIRTLVGRAGGDTDGLHGIDLQTEQRSHALSQRGPGIESALKKIWETNPDFDASDLHEEGLSAIRTDTFRFQRSNDSAELFALPDEQTDVSEDYPSKRAELSAELDRRLSEIDSPSIDTAAAADFSDDVKDQLADLGYVVD